MKNLKKYLLLATALLFVPACVHAEIVVKDTVTPEFIHNQGYSPEVSRIIQQKTKDPATPIPVAEKRSKLKTFGWYLREQIDPAVSRPNDFVEHNIQFSNTIEDL